MTLKLKGLIVKIIIFILSLSLAWWLIKSGTLNELVDRLYPIKFVTEFLAGAFYTSFLTIPLAMAMFLVLAPEQNPIILSIVAGLGASLTDVLLVRIFRDNFSKDLSSLTKYLKIYLIKKVLKLLKLDFIIPLLGVLIIASPLPDELGLVLLGTSDLKYHQIIILTFFLNTAGILLIVTPINLLT